MISDLSVFTFGLGTAGFLALAIILVTRSLRALPAMAMALAALLTAAWSAVTLSALSPGLAGALDTLRAGAWCIVPFTLLTLSFGRDRTFATLRAALVGLVAVELLLVSGLGIIPPTLPGIGATLGLTRMIIALLGLVLIENVLRNTDSAEIWSIKYVGFGLMVMFGFDLLVSALLVAGVVVPSLFIARPVIYLLAVPLIVITAVRNPRLALRLHSSRRVVFHTTTLMLVGVLLIGTAAGVTFVRLHGGALGEVLAIAFGFAALVAIAILITSAQIRARIRSYINANFFSYSYDYRLEWSRFIRAMAAGDDPHLERRALRTVAGVFSSPGGALWLREAGGERFLGAAHWSFGGSIDAIDGDDPLALQLAASARPILLDGSSIGGLATAAAPDWIGSCRDPWLIAPLLHVDEMVGMVLLRRPLDGRQLSWEDTLLLELLTAQMADYLVKEQTARALVDARQLEDFTKRFAFVIHDIKNIVGQLSLLVRNAEQHDHDPEFRQDLLLTVRNSVDTMKRLLEQLSSASRQEPARATAPIDLAELVGGFVARHPAGARRLALEGADQEDCLVAADAEALRSVLNHVVDNALEASAGKVVTLRLSRQGARVRIDVIDRGTGMSEAFIRDELFRPMRSTKGGGFGIGAYQARETMQRMGGALDVMSKLGEGTVVALSLPVTSDAAIVAAR